MNPDLFCISTQSKPKITNFYKIDPELRWKNLEIAIFCLKEAKLDLQVFRIFSSQKE